LAARTQAHRDGPPLPRIAVVDRPDGFYVLDGRHRVLVARTLGQQHIDAWT
jgi:ParB-like chromosome segregation protein Spo0J